VAVHRIRRQRLQLEAASQDDAFALRSELRERVAPAVTHALEQVFDELAPDSEVVRIDQLAINIRLTGDAEETQALDDVVLRQVRAQVAELLAPAGRESVRLRLTRESATTDRFERLMRYIDDGRLSWSDVGGGRLALIDELAKTLGGRLEEVIERWNARTSDTRVGPMTRLLQLLPESAWPRVIALTATSLTAALPALQSVVRSITPRHQRITLAAIVIVVAAFGGPRMSLSSIDESEGPSADDELESLLAGLPPETRTFIRRGESVPRDVREYAKAVTTGPNQTAMTPDARGTAQSVGPRDNAVERAASIAAGDDVGVLVSHAGLILIHPFLPQLFRALGLAWQPNAGFAPNDANRAVAALIYAATGAEEALAFELDFVRTILNVSADQPVLVSAGVLSDADRGEVDAMLRAVASHWSALGRTSVDGLRRAFLQRAGLLDEIESGYRLRVHVESFDVLLEQLPWSIATVRLPWMDRPIFTEWQV
jgi:hypothetical protein